MFFVVNEILLNYLKKYRYHSLLRFHFLYNFFSNIPVKPPPTVTEAVLTWWIWKLFPEITVVITGVYTNTMPDKPK